MITAFSLPLWIDDISNNIGSIFLISIGFAVVILFYALLTLKKASNFNRTNNNLIAQFTATGFASILFFKKSQQILFTQGLNNIFPENHKEFDNFNDILRMFRDEDADKIRIILSNKDDRFENQAVLRLKNGQIINCYVCHSVWNNKPIYALLMRNIHKEYQKMLSSIAENDSLKQERKMHTMILNNLPIPIWVRGEDLNIKYCNLQYLQMVDENEDVIKEGVMPSLFKGAKRIAKDALEGQNAVKSRHRLIVGGERLLWNINELYIKDLNGTVGFANEISALEKAEHELSSNLSTLEDLLDSSSSAMIIYGSNMRLRFYNQAYARIWGVEEAWLDSEPTFAEMIEHLRELRRLPEQINFQAFKQQRLRLFNEITEPREELFYLPDGRTLRNVAIPHSAGGMLFIYEDVTDKLALERSYNTLIAVQRESLDNLHEGVVVFGEDGRLKLKNPTFLSLWDLKEKDLKSGVHISQLLDKTRHLYATDNWAVLKEDWINLTQDRKHHTMRFERTDGAVLNCSIVPLPDGGVLITYIDNTATTLVERSLRERNEALEAGDRLKTEFLANMSYELRAPLTSISGFAEMLRDDYFGKLSEKQREYVEGIHNASQRLMHLINDILDLSSIEAGYMTLNITDFDIYKMLHTIINLLGKTLKEFDLITNIDCAEDIGNMQADEIRIRQILFHLLNNSVKYSSDKENNITIGARKTSSQIVIWVKDNGIGISEQEQKAVFDKFYRGRLGIRKSGTGLGLSMVKSFVELHGGYVEIKSKIGEGTTVTCYFPKTIKAVASEKRNDFIADIVPDDDNANELLESSLIQPTIH
jgi:signal transduction histidine kinase